MIMMTGECEAVPVEVALEPVPLVAGIADVGDGLAVCRGVVGVPHQLQLVLGVRGGRGDAMRPFTGVWYGGEAPALVGLTSCPHCRVEVG